MRINSIQSNYYQTPQTNFEGRYLNLLTKTNDAKIAPIDRLFEFKQIQKAYYKMWKELKLPENLKPRLIFEKSDFRDMSFNLKNYAISVNTQKDPLELRIRNKTGKNKQTLRHEIEHVRQFWDIIRLGAGDELKKDPEAKEIIPIIDSIEMTLGPLKPNSKEEKLAKLYSKGYNMYPDFNNIDDDSIYSLIVPLLYYLNPLEIGAQIASLKYRPKFIPKIKRTIFEQVKNLCREEQLRSQINRNNK